MRNIESYLEAMQLGSYVEEIVIKTIARLNECTPVELSGNRVIVARTYYQLLRYCQNLYKDVIPEKIKDELLLVYDNIKRIGIEASAEEKKDSSMITICFLNKLELYSENGNIELIDDKMLRETIEILLEELDDIHFVFEIQKNNKYVFPINRMVAVVVAKPEFISSDRPLSPYHIHILQLAVKLFKNNEDEDKILQSLLSRNHCNLKFIDYLKDRGWIIDTKDLLNYQQNGVMIFYNQVKNKVLIRHDKKEYFSVLPEWFSEKIVFDTEWDYLHQKEIGEFAEYELSPDAVLVDYSKVLETEEGKEKFLRLLFDKNVFNILIDGAIVCKDDSTYYPINPFSYRDVKIIRGRRDGKNGKSYNETQVLEALNIYRNSSFKTSKNCIMNRISFGLCMQLLINENVGVDALGLDNLLEDDWYQNQIMENWVKNCTNHVNAFEYVITLWFKENEYCCRRKKQKKNLDLLSVEEHSVVAQDILPLKSNLDWLFILLGCGSSDGWYVLTGNAIEDSEKIYLNVDFYDTVDGNKCGRDMNMIPLLVDINQLEDVESILDGEWGSGEKYYFLYHKTGIGKICNQSILKMISGIEKIQENALTLKTALKITKRYYNFVTEAMQLHESSLTQAGKRFFADFDSQVFYRLLHNLIWSEVTEETIDSYFRIILNHQLISFKDISEDVNFIRLSSNTLYVPKDSREVDGVLAYIFEKYLRKHKGRETNSLYDEHLELKEDGFYYHQDERINKIIFLFDNIEVGTSTKRTISAYLDICMDNMTEDEKEKILMTKNWIHKYYIKSTAGKNLGDGGKKLNDADFRKVVTLKDVIDRNNCNIEVHSYYGTEEGREAVDSFLKESNIFFNPTSFMKEITKKASQIESDVKIIWPKQKCGEFYAVIREFNMTKANVFPKEMLNDPDKAICMFVLKKEIGS